MLAVERELLAVEAVLGVDAFVDLGVELIDVLVLALMDVELVLHARQIGTVLGLLELFQFVLAPVDAVVKIAEVRVRVDEARLVDGRTVFRDDSLLDRERNSRQWLDKTFVQQRAQRDPSLMQFLDSEKVKKNDRVRERNDGGDLHCITPRGRRRENFRIFQIHCIL